jgi:Cu(I)/Ag(I) efflux system membrane fusion protein
MQLAGKPSLIDPTRAVAQKHPQKGPLEFKNLAVAAVEGETGRKLESLYAAYFAVQKSLAADQKPAPEEAQRLAQNAQELAQGQALPDGARKLADEIAKHAEHLHHMDLADSRKAFKPISHAVVTLATQVRSSAAEQPFTHFYCPMVPGGGGDWLQPGGELLNPYFGSQMLRCGEKVAEFPLPAAPASKGDSHDAHGTSPEVNKEA